MKTEIVIGGAGTGKTHRMTQDICTAIASEGLDHTEVAAITFTKNGREVLSSRVAAEIGVPVDELTKQRGNFRTVHSLALRETGIRHSQILADDRESREWLSEHFDVDFGSVDAEEEAPAGNQGDDADIRKSLAVWDLARARVEPYVQTFESCIAAGDLLPDFDVATETINRYETAKRLDDRRDFADVLAEYAGLSFTTHGITETASAASPPGNIRLVCVDEAQDSSALVDRVCRHVASGENVEHVRLYGDPFQSCHGFAGASAGNFLSWPAATQEVMPRSFRCPSDILDIGEECIAGVEGYFDRKILPAPHDGEIIYANSPDEAIDSIDFREETLILARCNFTLNKYRRALRDKEIPFREIDDDAADYRKNYFNAYLLQNELAVPYLDCTEMLKLFAVQNDLVGDLLERGVKENWKRGMYPNYSPRPLLPSDLWRVGAKPPLVQAIVTSEWPSLLLGNHSRAASNWLDAAIRVGPTLATNPKVVLSSIHRAKGAEAAQVVIADESTRRISWAADVDKERADEEARIAYIAVTRARRRLVICRHNSPHSLWLP